MRKLPKLFIILLILVMGFTGCIDTGNSNSQAELSSSMSKVGLTDGDGDINTLKSDYILINGGGYGGDAPDLGRFRSLFYNLPGPFADLVGRTAFDEWLLSRCPEEKENESVAVSFIRYFNISREDFERANEEVRQIWESIGGSPADGGIFEIYPVDLIFSFDNERINDFFRWENSPVAEERLKGIYPETVIPNVEINVVAPLIGAQEEQGMPPIDWNLNYVVRSVNWSPNIMPFAANTTYTVTAIISARTGYTLYGLTTATINGNPAVISNNTGITARISYTFTDGGGVDPGPTSVTVYSPWGWNGQFDGEYQVEQLRARVLPSNANQTVVWSSTNPDLIDVDQAGNVQIVQLCCCMRGGSSIFIRATAVDGTFGSFNVWANDRLMRTADYCENY